MGIKLTTISAFTVRHYDVLALLKDKKIKQLKAINYLSPLNNLKFKIILLAKNHKSLRENIIFE